jgi:hypothetical protein
LPPDSRLSPSSRQLPTPRQPVTKSDRVRAHLDPPEALLHDEHEPLANLTETVSPNHHAGPIHRAGAEGVPAGVPVRLRDRVGM